MDSRRFRYSLLAPLLRNYRYKLRMLDERESWLAEGYAYDHIRSSSLVSKETPAIFVPVLKAANTAIKHLLTGERPSNLSLDIHNKPAEFGLTNLWRYGLTPDDLVAGKRPCFTAVRHPVSRFWSAHSHLCSKEPQSILATAVRKHCGLSSEQAVTPEHLLAYIEEVPQQEREPHTRPQWALSGHRRIPFELIGRVESLGDFVREAVERGLLPPAAEERLEPHNRSQSASGTSRGNPLDQRIADCYEEDFQRFGYP